MKTIISLFFCLFSSTVLALDFETYVFQNLQSLMHEAGQSQAVFEICHNKNNINLDHVKKQSNRITESYYKLTIHPYFYNYKKQAYQNKKTYILNNNNCTEEIKNYESSWISSTNQKLSNLEQVLHENKQYGKTILDHAVNISFLKKNSYKFLSQQCISTTSLDILEQSYLNYRGKLINNYPDKLNNLESLVQLFLKDEAKLYQTINNSIPQYIRQKYNIAVPTHIDCELYSDPDFLRGIQIYVEHITPYISPSPKELNSSDHILNTFTTIKNHIYNEYKNDYSKIDISDLTNYLNDIMLTTEFYVIKSFKNQDNELIFVFNIDHYKTCYNTLINLSSFGILYVNQELITNQSSKNLSNICSSLKTNEFLLIMK